MYWELSLDKSNHCLPAVWLLVTLMILSWYIVTVSVCLWPSVALMALPRRTVCTDSVVNGLLYMAYPNYILAKAKALLHEGASALETVFVCCT